MEKMEMRCGLSLGVRRQLVSLRSLNYHLPSLLELGVISHIGLLVSLMITVVAT
jgi:hypothetical protein